MSPEQIKSPSATTLKQEWYLVVNCYLNALTVAVVALLQAWDGTTAADAAAVDTVVLQKLEQQMVG